MPESIFDVEALRAALGCLDLSEVARRTVEAAEDYMPGCAWLDEQGVVHYAETLSEVDGLIFCQAHEPDEDYELDDCYWVGCWLREVGLGKVAERLEVELRQALAGISEKPRTLSRGSNIPPG